MPALRDSARSPRTPTEVNNRSRAEEASGSAFILLASSIPFIPGIWKSRIATS
jgi:hypothetical protein